MNTEDYTLIYVNHTDVSVPDGPGVNEREMVRVLLRSYGSRVLYVGPTPQHDVGLPRDKMITWPWRRSILYQIVFELWLMVTLLRVYLRYGRRMVLFVRPSCTSLVAPLFSTLFGVKLVTKFAGLPFRNVTRKQWIPRPIRWLMLSFLRWHATASELVFAVTEPVARALETRYGLPPERIIHLTNGANTQLFNLDSCLELDNRFAQRLCPTRRYACYAGSFWMSGVDFLIEAVARLRRAGHDYGLVVAGGGEGHDRLTELAKAHGADEWCLFLGQVPYEQLPALYRRCHALTAVFPTEYMRDFGSSSQKVYQYLACGRPVVAARGPGHEFLAEPGLGRLVESENIDELAEAIRCVSEEPPWQGESIERRRFQCVSSRFTYESLAERLMGELDRLWSEREVRAGSGAARLRS